MLHMNSSSPTSYSPLPSPPQLHAMPHGIPKGPWGNLYRAAPGSQIPAVRYPGMAGAPVQLLGAGQKFGTYAAKTLVGAGFGGVIALGVSSKKGKIWKTALYTGLYTVGTVAIDALITRMQTPTTAA